jgi:stress-induced-phosphoprotein 1
MQTRYISPPHMNSCPIADVHTQCISLNSTFSKGYVRKGAALHGLRQYPEAVMAYESGLQIEPNSDILKKGLAEVEKAMKTDEESDSPFAPGGDMGLGKMFSDPGLMRKLENNAKTKEFMKDQAFVQKLRLLQASGGKGVDVQSMFADPRFLSVLGVAMGMDIVSRVFTLIMGLG